MPHHKSKKPTSKYLMSDTTDEDRLMALSVNRECNGLRRSRTVPLRLIDDKEYKREIAVEKESDPKLCLEKSATFYKIENYFAFDPVSHHVLVNFEGKFSNDREKYDWQPLIVLMLDYYANGRVDLVNELVMEAINHKVRFMENSEEYIAKTKAHLWKMERHPVIDFNVLYDNKDPFVAFIPREYQETGSLYEGKDMVVYAIKKADQRKIYGLTEYNVLKKALEKRRQKQLLERLKTLVETTLFELNTLVNEVALGEKTALENLDKVMHLLGIKFKLSEAGENFAIQERSVLIELGSKVPIEAMDVPFEEEDETELKRKDHVTEEEYRMKGPKKARFIPDAE
jgi:hypothetical protein